MQLELQAIRIIVKYRIDAIRSFEKSLKRKQNSNGM